MVLDHEQLLPLHADGAAAQVGLDRPQTGRGAVVGDRLVGPRRRGSASARAPRRCPARTSGARSCRSRCRREGARHRASGTERRGGRARPRGGGGGSCGRRADPWRHPPRRAISRNVAPARTAASTSSRWPRSSAMAAACAGSVPRQPGHRGVDEVAREHRRRVEHEALARSEGTVGRPERLGGPRLGQRGALAEQRDGQVEEAVGTLPPVGLHREPRWRPARSTPR